MSRKLFTVKLLSKFALSFSLNDIEHKILLIDPVLKNPSSNTVRRIIKSFMKSDLKDFTNLIISIYLFLFSSNDRIDYFESDLRYRIFDNIHFHPNCVRRELSNNKTAKNIFYH